MQSGNFLALMDANWITAMRTGAVAAHSIMMLAKKNYRNIGIIGLGNTSRAALLVLAEKNPSRHFDIRLYRYKNQEDDFVRRFEQYQNLSFSYADSYEELIKGSDVVISGATYLPHDLCKDDCFDEGVLVVPIHTLGFTNCDLFFDKVFADDMNHVRHFKNFNKFRSFAEVSDVVNGSSKGRENDKERIIVYNIGISLHDINFAAHIYQMMEGRQLLEVDFHEPADKFWI